MGNDSKLTVKLRPGSAMRVSRVSIAGKKLVYVLLAPKSRKYLHGRSRIVYIGTTKNGVSRIASSVAAKAEEILSSHGIKEVEVRVVTCRPRPRVKTWVKLERAMLLSFREMYGSIPKYNRQGKRIREEDEYAYFSRTRIRSIISTLG